MKMSKDKTYSDNGHWYLYQEFVAVVLYSTLFPCKNMEIAPAMYPAMCPYMPFDWPGSRCRAIGPCENPKKLERVCPTNSSLRGSQFSRPVRKLQLINIAFNTLCNTATYQCQRLISFCCEGYVCMVDMGCTQRKLLSGSNL